MQIRLLLSNKKERYYFAVFTRAENDNERWVYYLDGKKRKSVITRREIPAMVLPECIQIWSTETELQELGYKKYHVMFSNLMTREEILSVSNNDIVLAPNFTAPC